MGTYNSTYTGPEIDTALGLASTSLQPEDIGAHSGHIAGLQLRFSSVTELKVSAGEAHIESTNTTLEVPSEVTLSSLSLSADTWYHVYLYNNSGTATVEVSTTAPAAVYSGTARSKTGATTHRYLGSLKSKPSAAELVPFVHNLSSGSLMWTTLTADTGFGRMLIVAGTTVLLSSAENDKLFSCAEAAPSTARMIYAKLINRANQVLYFSDGDTTLSASTSAFLAVNKMFATDSINNEVFFMLPVNASQQAKYALATTATGSGPVVDCYGYFLER